MNENIIPLKIKKYKPVANYYPEMLFSDTDEKNIFQHIPKDYMEFINCYGEGIIDEWLRIFPISRVLQLTNIWRKKGHPDRLAKDFRKIVSSGFDIGAILVGDAVDGDQIIFHNGNYYVFCFNAEFEKLFKVDSLNGVFEFYRAGLYWGKIKLKTFMPFNSDYVLDGLHYIENISPKFTAYKTDEEGNPVYCI